MLNKLTRIAKDSYEQVLPKFSLAMQRLSAISIKEYAMADLAKAELDAVEAYRKSFEEEAKINTLFGYLEAKEKTSRIDVMSPAIEGFTKTIWSAIQKQIDELGSEVAKKDVGEVSVAWLGFGGLLCLSALGMSIDEGSRPMGIVVGGFAIFLIFRYFQLQSRRTNALSEIQKLKKKVGELQSLGVEVSRAAPKLIRDLSPSTT